MLSRRSLLAGGAVTAAAAAGGVWWERRVPSSPHPVPEGTREQVVTGSFRSAAVGRTVGFTVVYPRRPEPLPMWLHLHGRGGHHGDVRHLGPFLYDAVRRGGRRFAIVGVDGGTSYYHRRASGEDAQRMILEELLPVLVDRGLETGRFAVGGISMGGYGALLLAETLGRDRVTACAVDSPAIFASARERSKGSFDSDADFAAHDVVAGSARLVGIPLRVTCGTSDPFVPGVNQLLARVPSAERELGPGGHDRAWWDHAAPGQVAFVARHLP